jgi:hypothetical protein
VLLLEAEFPDEVNEDIFPGGLRQAIPVMWWLVHLLGDKVMIPIDEQFWLDNFPEDGTSRLVLKVEDGKLALVAEQLGWK